MVSCTRASVHMSTLSAGAWMLVSTQLPTTARFDADEAPSMASDLHISAVFMCALTNPSAFGAFVPIKRATAPMIARTSSLASAG